MSDYADKVAAEEASIGRVTQATQAALEIYPSGDAYSSLALYAAQAYEQGIIEDVSDAATKISAALAAQKLHLQSLPGTVASADRRRTLSTVAALEAALACLRTALKGTPKEAETSADRKT